MAGLWYRVFHRFAVGVFFHRIKVVHPERIPERGPALYLGLHRNGAVDALIYHTVLPRSTFMVSVQLTRHLLGRLFFTGIEVARSEKEGNKSSNAEALRRCVDLLRTGGELFIFPEGTSSLGPRHLPFRSGAARILQGYLEHGGEPIQVIPVGIAYEWAWGFRSNAEVAFGEPVPVDFPPGIPSEGRLSEIKRRFQAALEEAGTNVESEEYQDLMQKISYVATLGTRRSYFEMLKRYEKSIPSPILAHWRALEQDLKQRGLLTHQGVPLCPLRSRWLYLGLLVLLTPWVGAAALLNVPPLCLGWWAGRRFPDGPNVITLWRMLVGIPTFLLWMTLVAGGLVSLGRPLWILYYAAATWLGLKAYYRVKKLAVAVYNGFRFSDLRGSMAAFHRLVVEEVDGGQTALP